LDADDDDSEWEETLSNLSIEHATFSEGSTKPIGIQKKFSFRRGRYRSPGQIALSPRSLIATELSESLRRKQALALKQPPRSPLAFSGEKGDIARRKRSTSI
jgi:hypothetical protein